jgi:hypothetical protein
MLPFVPNLLRGRLKSLDSAYHFVIQTGYFVFTELRRK